MRDKPARTRPLRDLRLGRQARVRQCARALVLFVQGASVVVAGAWATANRSVTRTREALLPWGSSISTPPASAPV